MVRVRVRRWVIHCAFECPLKDICPRVCVCVCVCVRTCVHHVGGLAQFCLWSDGRRKGVYIVKVCPTEINQPWVELQSYAGVPSPAEPLISLLLNFLLFCPPVCSMRIPPVQPSSMAHEAHIL